MQSWLEFFENKRMLGISLEVDVCNLVADIHFQLRAAAFPMALRKLEQ
jgi:hypothetical protein